jgi:DNA-binding PadR family transcriptional regulator
MPRSPRRTETPVTTTVAAMQGLRWGPSSAQNLIAVIDARTSGYVHIHVGLIYKALDQLVQRGLVRRSVNPVRPHGAAIYSLTAKGKTHAKREGESIAALFDAG